MNKWIAEFDLEDGDTMPEHMDLEYNGVKIDFYCRPKEPATKNDLAVDKSDDFEEWKLNEDKDSYLRIGDIVDRFKEIDEHYNHSPWNLAQIFSNLNILQRVECKMESPTTKNDLAVDTDKLISDCKKMSFDIDFFNKPLKVVALDAVKNIVNDLPSVTPQEPRWIPVSERMPEPNRLVLCYITTGATETYFLALRNDTLNAWEEGIGGCRLLENDLGYKVIAWLPLPEP